MNLISAAPLQATHAHSTRSRNHDGRFRQKRADTHLSTLEHAYGEISDRRADCHLGTIREATHQSLSKLVHGHFHEVTHAAGLDGRQRTQHGRIRAKNGNTHLSSLEAKYGEISCLPGDTHLSVLRAMVGGKSLTYILHHRNEVNPCAQ